MANLKRLLGWNRTSFALLSAFIALLALIGYIWWPLAEEYLQSYDPRLPFWQQMDWLLLGNFLAMSLLIMARANLRRDLPIVLIGLAGGLVIESWGTQTLLWRYYTNERPPLWIIPAWPIASLAIDRLYRILLAIVGARHGTVGARQEDASLSGRVGARQKDASLSGRPVLASPLQHPSFFDWAYWIIFPVFYLIMLVFIRPTIEKSLTLMALFLCAFLILTEKDRRGALLTFLAGSALGYFLELWGTTRYCWIYYTLQTPPFFAVLAHGMAAVAFWRTVNLFWLLATRRPS